MSPALSWPQTAIQFAGGALLLLVAWGGESSRRVKRGPVRGVDWSLLLGRAHEAQELRLAIWVFFTLFLSVQASVAGNAGLTGPLRFTPLGPSLLERGGGRIITLSLGIAAGLLLVLAGWVLGRVALFPSGLRWALAPVHGLSMWILWAWSRLDRKKPPRKGSRLRRTGAAGGRTLGAGERSSGGDRDDTRVHPGSPGSAASPGSSASAGSAASAGSVVSGASLVTDWSVDAGRRPPAAGGLDREASLQERVQELASVPLEEVMIPRSQVTSLAGSMLLRDALRELRRAPHARYPAFGDSIDQPLGMVRMLDLARPDSLERPVRDFVQPASIVPETMKGFDLLEDLCRAPMPAALVVDEFGSMAGLVTVEDLIEVVVGDLVGEHEVVRARVVQLGADLYSVDGTCRVDEFNERLGPLLPEGEYETVAGLFLDAVGRIPPAGERLMLPLVELEVLERNDRRILTLRARIRSDAESASGVSHPGRSDPAQQA